MSGCIFTGTGRAGTPDTTSHRSFPGLLFFGHIPRNTPSGMHVVQGNGLVPPISTFTALYHVQLGYSVAIMRSVTIFSRSTIQQQRLVYSFNTFANTPFDAQNIVHRFGIITKSKSLPWRCQPVAPGCQLKAKATDSIDCTLIRAPLNSNPTAEAGTIMCGGDLLNR
jgi:hypothetical protein